MGGRSNSGGSNTSGQTQGTMNSLAKGRVSNGSMMDILSQLQNSQMGGMLPIIGALIKDGKGVMASNPMAPFFGQSEQTPDFLSEFIEKYNAPEPPPPPQQPQQPQQPPYMSGMGQSGIGAVPNMTPEKIAEIQRMHGYGRQ